MSLLPPHNNEKKGSLTQLLNVSSSHDHLPALPLVQQRNTPILSARNKHGAIPCAMFEIHLVTDGAVVRARGMNEKKVNDRFMVLKIKNFK